MKERTQKTYLESTMDVAHVMTDEAMKVEVVELRGGPLTTARVEIVVDALEYLGALFERGASVPYAHARYERKDAAALSLDFVGLEY